MLFDLLFVLWAEVVISSCHRDSPVNGFSLNTLALEKYSSSSSGSSYLTDCMYVRHTLGDMFY